MDPFIFNSHVFVFIILVAVALALFRRADRDAAFSFLARWASAFAIAVFLLFVIAYAETAQSWLAAHAYVGNALAGHRFQVGLIGLFVGVVELVARYRDNPRRALVTAPAAFYIAINVAACVLALRVLQIVRPEWLFGRYQGGELSLFLVATAGFGAVALFRSSIFKVKTTDGEIAVGPSIILDTLLAASDRAVDRILASPRGTRVVAIMQDVSFEKAKTALPTYCFALMQNVSQQEQKDVGDQIKALSTADMTERVKSLNLGLLLLNVVGEGVLKSAVENLKDFVKGEPLVPDPNMARVAETMRGVDFLKARSVLPALCFVLNPAVSELDRGACAARVEALTEPPPFPGYHSLMLGLIVASCVGFPALQLAVRQLDSEIRHTPDDAAVDGGDVGRIADLMRDIDFDKASILLPAYCMQLNATVSDENQKRLAARLTELKPLPFPPRVKTLLLGLYLIDLVGLPALRLAVAQIGPDIRT